MRFLLFYSPVIKFILSSPYIPVANNSHPWLSLGICLGICSRNGLNDSIQLIVTQII